MILENYDEFLANKLGFSFNSKTNKWDLEINSSSKTFDVKSFMCDEDGKFKIEVGEVTGSFDAENLNITSAENLPVVVTNSLKLRTNITDFSKLPTQHVYGLLDLNCALTRNEDFRNNIVSVKALMIKEAIDEYDLRCFYHIKIKALSLINCEFKTLENAPVDMQELRVVYNNHLEDANGLQNTNLKDVTFSHCQKLTSLAGLPNTVTKITILECDGLPKIIKDFAVQININGFKDFYMDLLKFIIKAKRMTEIDTVAWPEDFKSNMPSLIKSFTGLNKFNI